MLDLESLKMFGDVVRAGSLTRASQELYLSKSMLKKHVDGLERELGVTLLRRRCAAAERESGSRTLRVANFSDYVFQITNYYMDAYLERHPSDTIVPVFIPYAEVFSGLRKGLFDVAVAVRPPSEESQGILSTTLYAMRMWASSRPPRPWPRRPCSRARTWRQAMWSCTPLQPENPELQLRCWG